MRLHRMTIVIVALLVLSGLAASTAHAEEKGPEGGPLWYLGAGPLAENATRAIVSTNEGAYKLEGKVGTTTVTIECTEASDSGVIYGGNPGTDLDKIKFKTCRVEGMPNCKAKGIKPLGGANAGEIPIETLTVLVYPEGVRDSALDAFAPEGEAGNENLFTELRLEGGTANCGSILNNATIRVFATGTQIKIRGTTRRCGMLAQVGKANANSEFVLTKAEEVAKVLLLRLPQPAIEKAEIWEATPKAFKKIEAKLEAGGAAGKLTGTSEVEVEKEELGWDE